MPTFSPPQSGVAILSRAHRLFTFYTQPIHGSVIHRNGHYVQVFNPWIEEVEALEEGVTYFQGGRTYEIDDATATALTVDGFGESIV